MVCAPPSIKMGVTLRQGKQDRPPSDPRSNLP
jgi:hypothetical protein